LKIIAFLLIEKIEQGTYKYDKMEYLKIDLQRKRSAKDP
jgi:hypothetical protein